jgi:hypothetical protein
VIELNGVFQVFLGGILGPALVELAKVISWGKAKKIAARYKRITYWIATLAVLIVSGTVTVIHGIDHIPILRAVQLGISAPLLVSAWANAATTRKIEQDNGLERFSPPMPGESDKSRLKQVSDLLSW